MTNAKIGDNEIQSPGDPALFDVKAGEEKDAIEKEKAVMALLLDHQKEEIAQLNARLEVVNAQLDQLKADPTREELARVTRARDIACFNIVDLNFQRQTLTDTLRAALTLIDYLMGDMRANNVHPSVACTLAKKQLDERMNRLFKRDVKHPSRAGIDRDQDRDQDPARDAPA